MKKTLLLLLTFCTASLFSQTTLSEKESKFITHSAEHTLYEIKLAQLAQSNASAPEVKSLASDMLSYHTKALGDLKNLAAKKNVNISNSLSEKLQKHYDKLAKKQGADFDKAYTKCVVKSHKMGACYLKKTAKKAKDEDVKSWAAANYPILEQHRDKAKETCKKIKK